MEIEYYSKFIYD